jgi:hypothetical protein
MSAKVRQFFGGKDRTFLLTIGGLEELQDLTRFGPRALLQRIAAEFRPDDIRETLRLGLIGGGMEGEAAARMVDREVVPGRLLKCGAPAIAVLSRALDGDEDDAPGESKAAKAKRRSRTAGSASPPSTETAAAS